MPRCQMHRDIGAQRLGAHGLDRHTEVKILFHVSARLLYLQDFATERFPKFLESLEFAVQIFTDGADSGYEVQKRTRTIHAAADRA